jgi:hypothetical protein
MTITGTIMLPRSMQTTFDDIKSHIDAQLDAALDVEKITTLSFHHMKVFNSLISRISTGEVKTDSLYLSAEIVLPSRQMSFDLF